MVGIPTPNNAVTAVRALAETGARQRGTTLLGSDLRLFDPTLCPAKVALPEQDESEAVSPFALGRAYELLLAPAKRRKAGAHLTPEHIARQLVQLMGPPRPHERVLDPAVGGAAFLLAAADTLVEAGGSPHAVLDQLCGVDIDPVAVAVAEAALGLWAIDHDVAPTRLERLEHGDGLLDALPTVDRVVGNPPFLNQLRSSSSHTSDRRALLRDRWGDLVGAYTDDAWLFLAAGLDALDTDGTLAMVQPVSILAARHSEAVRRYSHERGELGALWVARDRVFDAAVQVCGLVIHSGTETQARPVQRFVGADFASCATTKTQPLPNEWGSAGAATLDIPSVSLVRRSAMPGVVGDMATATAGFRDQFYGLVPYVSELDVSQEKSSPEVDRARSRLVTVGMIDVLGLGWGARPCKFAKQSYLRPVVDVDRLRTDDPTLGEWVDARRRPKLLMATQTRVVELWVDSAGQAVPTTPVVSIEPLDGYTNERDLWLLAAALSAPAMSAYFMAEKFGTAMALNAMKLAAKDVLAAPLPIHEEPWREAAALLQRNEAGDLQDFAILMGAAFGNTQPELIEWWRSRLPRG